MPRSGSTLQYQIVCELAKKSSRNCLFSGWKDNTEFKAIADLQKEKKGYIVFKNHIFSRDAEKFMRNSQEYQIFYIYRDIRDSFASFVQKENLEFKKALNSGFIEKCIDNFYKWSSCSRNHLYISRYEDVVGHLHNEVEGIANIMAAPVNEHVIDEIANNLSLDRQKKAIKNYDQAELVTKGKQRFHQESLLHLNHIKDAKVGKYQEFFSAEQVQYLNDTYDEWLREAGYK